MLTNRDWYANFQEIWFRVYGETIEASADHSGAFLARMHINAVEYAAQEARRRAAQGLRPFEREEVPLHQLSPMDKHYDHDSDEDGTTSG